GIRLEACGYALELFGIEPEDLYSGVTTVGNSLNSLIGYQAKGYSLIPMN
ncbi:MAG: DsrE family protein, partial [Deltaproteobacteria bacterium]|nr:DsrE family protein [Deltaproteobacteria bacterium]